MQGILYEEPSAWLFLLVTCVLGGGAAWITGRAYATTWRSIPSLVVAILLLGIAVRFVHHSMFAGTMLAPKYYVVDTVFLMITALVSFRVRRTQQMSSQYYWLYERTGPFTWKERPNPAEGS